MSFLKFMSNPIGRGIRVVAGIAIAAVGLMVVGHAAGIALAVVGTIVFLAGALNFCLFAPLAGGPFRGARFDHN
ncbi:MAG: YgaP family membrane protein [Candidatus Dormibacteria bacterium]